MSIYAGSRYEYTKTYYDIIYDITSIDNGKAILLLRQRNMLKLNLSDAFEYQFVEGDRLESLAFTFYGDPSMWWAILDANPKYMDYFDIKNGDIINIPSLDEINRAVIEYE